MAAAHPIKDRPDVELFHEVSLIDQLAKSRLERALPQGLSYSQFGILNHLTRQGEPMSPAQLVAALNLTKGAVTNLLQKLEAQGLIAITTDPDDGRRKWVSLSDGGGAEHQQCLKRLRPLMEEMRAAIAEDDFKAALPFLKQLRLWLDQNRQAAP
jgi:DNA-binding MarR family transcriptional regulator